MKYPLIFDHKNCRTYFREFYELNKNSENPASYRSLAYEINWPPSYLNDVIFGRKNLTVPRALEFASIAKLNLLETERLIYISFIDSSTSDVQSYFLNKLEKELNSDSYTLEPENNFASTTDDYPETNVELHGDITASALLKLLGWSNGKIEKALIPKMLFLFPELNDPLALEEKLAKLVRNKNIKILSSNEDQILEVEISKSIIHFMITKETAPLAARFTDNMGAILRNKNVAGCFNSGYLLISKNRFKEIRLKMNSFRNWLIEIEKESLEQERTNLKNALLFQYDLNLAPIMDLKEVGLSTLGEWENLEE